MYDATDRGGFHLGSRPVFVLGTTMEIKRLKQCDKCPWKVSTNPDDIPGGYSRERHRELIKTIAQPGSLWPGDGTLNVMACHEAPKGAEYHCVGWLNHQLGVGNNMALRFALLHSDRVNRLEIDGPQHQRFEDTLPKREKGETPCI